MKKIFHTLIKFHLQLLLEYNLISNNYVYNKIYKQYVYNIYKYVYI
jgi:hypothetical protein